MPGPKGTTEERKSNRLSCGQGVLEVSKECIAAPLDQTDMGF
jgi:hypothetical protein